MFAKGNLIHFIIFFISTQLISTLAIVLSPASADMDKNTKKPFRVVFLGDSLTAGYGLDPEESYPNLVSDALNEEKLRVDIVNAGVSGDTTSGGLRRITWLMQKPIDVLVLALGANDGLRGVPPKETEANLRAIISQMRAKNPKVKILLAGMLIPPSMGPAYTQSFKSIFPRVAEEEQVALIPFLLEGVAAETQFNLPDGIHPNAAGQRIIAKTVLRYLTPLLKGI